MSLRMEKVNRELMRQIVEIIQQEIDDPHLGILSITRVQTTPDLKESKIYFSLLDETKLEKAEEILNKMNKFIRSSLSKKIRLKVLPQLKFVYDDSIKYSVDIYQKIEDLKNADRRPACD